MLDIAEGHTLILMSIKAMGMWLNSERLQRFRVAISGQNYRVADERPNPDARRKSSLKRKKSGSPESTQDSRIVRADCSDATLRRHRLQCLIERLNTPLPFSAALR